MKDESIIKMFFLFIIIVLIGGYVALITTYESKIDDLYDKIDEAQNKNDVTYEKLDKMNENIKNIDSNVSDLRKFNKDNVELILENLDEADFDVSDAMFIEEARKRYMSVNDWSYDHDCSVLTQEFTLLMKEFGVEMYKVHAFNNNTNVGHTYNCASFDVQQGFINDTWDSYTVAKTTHEIDYNNDSLEY